MHGTYPTHPYYMDMRWLTLGRGFGGYFNWLFNVELRWQIWAIGFTAILLMFLFLKKKPAAFFQLYIFITFLPVIFLINHRAFFYLRRRLPYAGRISARNWWTRFPPMLDTVSGLRHRESSLKSRSYNHRSRVDWLCHPLRRDIRICSSSQSTSDCGRSGISATTRSNKSTRRFLSVLLNRPACGS